MKKLTRSKDNRIIAGVCGGLGAYLDIDPNIIRILWALVSVIGYIITGIVVYIIAWALIPEEGEEEVIEAEYTYKDE
jgi:phage shock protein C